VSSLRAGPRRLLGALSARDLCADCLAKAVTENDSALNDSALSFANVSLSGGLQVNDGTGWRQVGDIVARVNGVACRVEEHRFGGVVAQPLGTAAGERIAGCLLAGAAGDALGAPVEFDGIERIRSLHGGDELRLLAPAYGRRGAITDDTQMTLVTAERLLCVQAAGAVSTADRLGYLARAYRRWLNTQEPGIDVESEGWLLSVTSLHARRAPGTTCLRALIAGTGA
jgi:hypothetical protein